MTKPERPLKELKERLGHLLADWNAEVSAVLRALENHESRAATHAANVEALEDNAAEIEKLRQRVRERDLALDHLAAKSRQKDARFAELEKEHKKARARIEELERQVSALDKPEQRKHIQPDDYEAMRAEAAARKSLVKSLRTDAERGKALEKDLAETREVMASMQESIDRHVRTIAELRRSSEGWERKYRELSAVDGSHTIVIDMSAPLREARHEHSRRYKKG